MRKIKIGRRYIGDKMPLYFIADIGANHDGNIGRAFKLIKSAKKAGADAVKFQNFQASKIVSKNGFEKLGARLSHQSAWRKPVYEVYEDASIPFEWTPKLKKKCDEEGIDYFTSAYDMESADFVEPYLDLYKIGSGDITWLEIIEHIARKGKPVLLATGASSFDDVKRAMAILKPITHDIVLMQCNTNYTGTEDNIECINLNVLKTYREQFPGVVLGLSCHMPGDIAVLGAVALGATVIEKHFTDDNNRIGPDHKFAMTPKTWKEMVWRANNLYRALGDGEKRVEENEKETAVVQRRGLYFVKDLPKGHVIVKEDVFPLRPVPKLGILPYEIDVLLGHSLKKNVKKDTPVQKEDIEK